MPSAFLKKRFPEFLKQTGGSDTVQYIAFNKESSVDELTGDIDESVAYDEDASIRLPALIDFQPSKAMREKIGPEIDFNAIVVLSAEHVEEKEITLKVGDAFILPGESDKYYVQKVIKERQSGNEFIGYTLAIGRNIGSR